MAVDPKDLLIHVQQFNPTPPQWRAQVEAKINELVDVINGLHLIYQGPETMLQERLGSTPVADVTTDVTNDQRVLHNRIT